MIFTSILFTLEQRK